MPVRGGGTVQTCPAEDAVLGLEPRGHLFRRNPFHAEGHAQRASIARGIDAHARHFGQSFAEHAGELAHVPARQPLLLDRAQSAPQGGDPQQVERTGLIAVGPEGGLLERFRLAARAPFLQGRHVAPRREIAGPQARRPQQPFVGGAGEEVDSLLLQIERQQAGRLGPIDEHGRVGEGRAQARQVLHCAVDVRGVLHDQQGPRPLACEPAGRVHVDPAKGVGRQRLDRDAALACQATQRPHHRVVLHGRDGDAIARLEKPLEHQVQPFRGAAHKRDRLRSADPEHSGESLAHLENQAGRFEGRPVSAPTGVRADAGRIAGQLFPDRRGLGPARGRVVEIDQLRNRPLRDARPRRPPFHLRPHHFHRRHFLVARPGRPIEPVRSKAIALEDAADRRRVLLAHEDRHPAVGAEVPRQRHHVVPQPRLLERLLGGQYVVDRVEHQDPRGRGSDTGQRHGRTTRSAFTRTEAISYMLLTMPTSSAPRSP